MAIRTLTADTYAPEERSHSLVVAGRGFTIRVTSTVGPVQYECRDGRFVIDCNEASAEAVGPLAQLADLEPVSAGVEVPVVVSDRDIEYLVGEYENLPIYSGYHGVTPDGEVYEFETGFGSVDPDPLLDLPGMPDHHEVVRNVDTGHAVPVETETVQEWFDSERISAALRVR